MNKQADDCQPHCLGQSANGIQFGCSEANELAGVQ